jgi:hypothetical protein
MSAETKAALDAAIAAHVADECHGDMAGAWVVVAETTSLDEIDADMSSWYIGSRAMQSSIMTNGLLYSALTTGNAQRVDDD